jgi:hypothetical protein
MIDTSKITLVKTAPPTPKVRQPFEVSQLSKELQAAINDQAEHAKHKEYVPHLDDIIDGEYSHWQLHCAFNLVTNPNGWKEELSGEVDKRDVDIVMSAASFFAGSPCDVVGDIDEQTVRMEGPGYYHCIGS